MGRRGSEASEKGYLKGNLLTVEELKQRYSFALTINNHDIFSFLLEVEAPATTKDLLKKLGIRKAEPLNARMRRLFNDGLVVRFWLGKGFGYLLSEKGYNAYQKVKTI